MLAKSERAAGHAAERIAARQERRAKAPAAPSTAIPNDAQICSCNNVTKGQICDAIRDKNLMFGRGNQARAPGRAPAAAAVCRS